LSYGKERPECADASDGCWATNRRGVNGGEFSNQFFSNQGSGCALILDADS
jgi:hypothetical protein